ncbi:hypothetical protein BDZ45DRAFT_675784 [Acephala macrosclerotiorum]|nr:hypothetical protein BDZ45DRAFT_675784 [Acephala macrosclerotiorum]
MAECSILKLQPNEVDNVLPAELQTFHCFDKLPIEMRLKIWKLASCVQRNVDIWCENLEIELSCRRRGYIEDTLHVLSTTRSIPAVLHVCHESRREALQHYSVEFGTSQKIGGQTGQGGRKRRRYTFSSPPTYINWAVDRLCLFSPDSFQRRMRTDVTDFGATRDLQHTRPSEFVQRLQEMGLKHLAINTQSKKKIQNSREPDSKGWYLFYELLPLQGQLEELILFDGRNSRWHMNDGKEMKAFDVINFEDIPLSLGDGRSMRNSKKALDEHLDQMKWISDAEREQMKSIIVRPCKVLRNDL